MDERLAQIEVIMPRLAVRVPNPFYNDHLLSLPATETVDDIVNGMMQASGRDDSDDLKSRHMAAVCDATE